VAGDKHAIVGGLENIFKKVAGLLHGAGLEPVLCNIAHDNKGAAAVARTIAQQRKITLYRHKLFIKAGNVEFMIFNFTGFEKAPCNTKVLFIISLINGYRFSIGCFMDTLFHKGQ
jgi:hypothetical protein